MDRAVRILLVIVLALMVISTLMCGFDCIVAHTDDAPVFLFSFLLPMLQEEFVQGGRFVSLAASVMLPVLAVGTPVVTALFGVLVRRRASAGSRWERVARVGVVAAGICFLLSLCAVCSIYCKLVSI